MVSDYLFGIFWSLYCLSFHLITSLVSFGHCIVCRSIYGVWLPLDGTTDNTMTKRYQRGNQIERQTIQWPKDTKEVIRWNDRQFPLWFLLVIVLSVVPSDYLFCIFWSLYCLSFNLITSLVSFGHCIVCRSIYGVWLPLWYLLVIVLSQWPKDTRGNQKS
jgi:hypothetical protein